MFLPAGAQLQPCAGHGRACRRRLQAKVGLVAPRGASVGPAATLQLSFWTSFQNRLFRSLVISSDLIAYGKASSDLF